LLLRRILYYIDVNQVVVSSGDLQGRIDRWVTLKTLRNREEADKPGPGPVYRRSHLSRCLCRAAGPWEQTLADIWQRLFGFDRIGIRDDGEGMTQDDAILAFEHHATSKIATAEDLAAISTLGFRGEALPSIAAVAR
jgi:hypothetical protein